MQNEPTSITTWSRAGTTFSGTVHVDPKVTEWLADQEPGASLYRWGLLLGAPPNEGSPDINVEDVTPLQNRAQLDAALAAWSTRGRSSITAVGLCGWGKKRAQREVLRLFEENFPESGRVLVFAAPGAKGRPDLQVYVQDGIPAPVHSGPSLQRRVITWTLAVLAVIVGVPLLLSTISNSQPAETVSEAAQPLHEAAMPAPVPTPAAEAPAPAETTATPARKSASPKRRTVAAAPHLVNREQMYVDEGPAPSPPRRWSKPFTWLRDSTWKPVSGMWSRHR